MSSLDCCGIFKTLGVKLGLIEKAMTSEEALKEVNEESKKWIEKDRKEFWTSMCYLPQPIKNSLLEEALVKFQKEHISPGVAVHLGCGTSSSTVDLLKKGWKVIAVDNCNGVLEILKNLANKVNENWIKEKQLTFICEKMESFEFPKDTRLVLATNAFSYCNPKKLKEVWDKAYNALEKGGRIVGNFFSQPNLGICPSAEIVKNVENVSRDMFGSWITKKSVVDALLDSNGYEKEKCEYNKYWFVVGSRCVEFIGHKI